MNSPIKATRGPQLKKVLRNSSQKKEEPSHMWHLNKTNRTTEQYDPNPYNLSEMGGHENEPNSRS